MARPLRLLICGSERGSTVDGCMSSIAIVWPALTHTSFQAGASEAAPRIELR